jgi:hypothetical protein
MGCDCFSFTSVLSYVSVQFSLSLSRAERTAANITNMDAIVLNMKNSKSAIIIFVPNLGHVLTMMAV